MEFGELDSDIILLFSSLFLKDDIQKKLTSIFIYLFSSINVFYSVFFLILRGMLPPKAAFMFG